VELIHRLFALLDIRSATGQVSLMDNAGNIGVRVEVKI
jgi:hypothetical protein